MTRKALKRILYVEDDSSIGEIVDMTLTDFGDYDVQYCDRGQIALDAIENYMPDLILMDVMMPGMDGPTTMKHIQNMDKVKHIPVVFMTAKAQVHEQAEYLTAGAKGVLVKAFDPMTLCDELEAIWNSLPSSMTVAGTP